MYHTVFYLLFYIHCLIICQATSFCSKDIPALAGLVEGRLYSLCFSETVTYFLKYCAAFCPLKKIYSILECAAKNVLKSLCTSCSIALSRLPIRVQVLRTSQTATLFFRSMFLRVSYAEEKGLSKMVNISFQNAFLLCL